MTQSFTKDKSETLMVEVDIMTRSAKWALFSLMCFIGLVSLRLGVATDVTNWFYWWTTFAVTAFSCASVGYHFALWRVSRRRYTLAVYVEEETHE